MSYERNLSFKTGDIVRITDYSYSRTFHDGELRGHGPGPGGRRKNNIVVCIVDEGLPTSCGYGNPSWRNDVVLVEEDTGKIVFSFTGRLEYVNPRIEITVKINGKESKLSDISKETLSRLRKDN